MMKSTSSPPRNGADSDKAVVKITFVKLTSSPRTELNVWWFLQAVEICQDQRPNGVPFQDETALEFKPHLQVS